MAREGEATSGSRGQSPLVGKPPEADDFEELKLW